MSLTLSKLTKTKTILQSAVKNAQFGEWPHVCAMLKKEFIGESVGIEENKEMSSA